MFLTINRYAALLFAALIISAGDANAQLAPPSEPAGNPTTEQKRILGKMLFWDEQVSSDDTVACGTCHIPAVGGSDPRLGRHPGPDGQFSTDDDTIGSPGIVARDDQGQRVTDPAFGDGLQVTGRASPGTFMSMYADDIFWDGRARSEFRDPQNPAVTVISSGGGLESQAVGPILSSVEMAHQDRNWNQVVTKLMNSVPMALAERLPADIAAALNGNPSYTDLFAAAFGSPTISARRIGQAIAVYERTLVPDQTPWDRFMRGEQNAMTPEQIAGWTSFQDDTVCDNCHVPPHFTDHLFYNIGLRPAAEDIGREEVTLDAGDHGRFKTPSLRNVGLRTALTHVGWLDSLQNTVDFYNAMALNTGHTQFTAFQSDVPAPNGGPTVTYALVTFFPGDPVAQAPVLDFLENALTDPRAANETFPFDRPVLDSETMTLLSYNLAGPAWTAPRAELVEAVIRATNADAIGLQETDATMLNDLGARLADIYDIVTFPGGSSRTPMMLRQEKFLVVDSGSVAGALTCDGHEFTNYAVLEIVASAEKVAIYNNFFCPPGTAFPVGEVDAESRNEASATVLAEAMLSNRATWRAPGIAIGDFNAVDTSDTIGFLASGQASSYADSNPVLLVDAVRTIDPASAGLAGTQWSLATDASTGAIVLDASVVDNPDTAAAANLQPLLIKLAVDTTPANISASPGDPLDTTPPTTPGGLLVVTSGQTSIDLRWNAATDNTGVSRYRVSRSGLLLATVTSPGYSDTSLQQNTSYSYRVTAIDASGNESAAAVLSASTGLPAGPPPPTPSSGGGQTGLGAILLLLFAVCRRAFATVRRG
jgi:cytochrome c peroxidase